MDTLLTQIPTTLLGWIGLIATIIAGFFWIRNQDVNSLRASNKDLREENKYLQEQITKLQQDFAQLKGVLMEKDKRIETLEQVQVTQTVNPEMAAYMKEMITLRDDVKSYMKETKAYLVAIDAKTK